MENESSLRELTFDLKRKLKEALSNPARVVAVLERCPHPAYVKRLDETIVHTNAEYNHRFLGGTSAAGRNGSSYLDDEMATVSRNSDNLIAGACSVVEFEHHGLIYCSEPAGKCLADLRTIKIAISDIGNPVIAILGVTEVVHENASAAWKRDRTLNSYLRQLKKMSVRHQRCATMLASGVGMNQIAEELGVSRRTADKHRAEILSSMDLDNIIQLSQLLCRLQDAGLGDFGVFEIEDNVD